MWFLMGQILLLKQKINNEEQQWRDIGKPPLRPGKVSLEDVIVIILKIEKTKSLVSEFKKIIEGRKDVQS